MAGRSVVIRLRGEIGDFQAKMRQAKASVGETVATMNSATRQGEQMRRSFGTVADQAGKMGLAAAGGLAYVSKAAMDWETAWAGVTKTVEGTPEQMAALEEELRGLATTLPATHEEIAGVAEAAGQLGIARESVASFTETMVALGETTNLTADEAATSIARFSNIMGTSADEVDRIGSTLVDLGNNSATTEAEILALGQRLSAAGQIAGLAESDVLAFASTLTSVGVEAEAGGTALSKVFTSVRDAAIDGGAKLDAFAEVAGVSATAFQQAFQEDAAGAVEMFIAGLGRLNASGQSTTAVFDELQLTDQRLMRALLSTASAGDLLSDSLDLGRTAWEDNTALAIEAAKRYETTASQMRVSWNTIKDSAIEFGEAALPILAGAADKVAGFAQAVGDLPGPVKSATTGMLGLTAVFGGGLWFTSKTINAVSDMRGALSDLGLSAGGTSKALKGVGVAAAALAGLTVLDSLQKQNEETLPGLEALTEQLIELSRAGAAASLSAEFESLDESVSRMVDKNWAQALQDQLYDWGAPGSDSAVDEAKAEIEALDTALANLVATGNADVAADSLENLATAQGLSKGQMDNLLGLMPQYEEALIGQRNAADLAGDASGGAADGMAEITGAATEGEEAVDGFADAVEGFNDTIDQRGNMRDYRQAIRDFNDELADAPEKMKRGSEAWDDAEARLDGIAESALEVAEDLAGADRVRFLARARRAFVEAAEELGIPKRAARELATQLGLLDKQDPRIDVDLNPEPAHRKLDLLGIRLDKMTRDRSVRIDVVQAFSEAGHQVLGGPQEYASGGYTGSGGKYEPAGVVHRGEYVINAEQTARHFNLLERINGGYAAGGPVATRPAPVSAGMDAAALAQQLSGLTAPLIGEAKIYARDLDDIQQHALQGRRNSAIGGTGGGRQ